ncbi:hypothetical protein ABLE92_22960 [Gordonia sp. VNQ95]|uniref:hypothetical protein n=1 Tax=Gordonia sp. VNQ95 TaxID=3156619 RepID=UPI0032B41081
MGDTFDDSCRTVQYYSPYDDCSTTVTVYSYAGDKLWELESPGPAQPLAGMLFVGPSRIL